MAEEMAVAEMKAAPLAVGEVALAVRDLARTEAFYRDVLGLKALERGPESVRLGAGGRGFLTLRHRPGARPDDPSSAGLFHTAFLLPDRADLARWLRHAARLRWPLDGASDHLVSEAIYLADPEGNGVEVYADRPRALWRWRDGRVEMATRPLDLRGLAAAAGEAAWTGAPAGARIGHVHLRVGDVAEAVRFYAGTLGLEQVAAYPGAAFLSTGGYHHHIAANTWRSAGAGPRAPDRAGLDEILFEAADAEVLRAIAARSPDAADGTGALSLVDPWGTRLRVRRA